MGPTSSSPYTQQPATCPYLGQINPIHVLFNIRFNVTIHLAQRLLSGLLSSSFSIKIMYTFIFPPFVPHAQPILSTSISSTENYSVSTNHEAPSQCNSLQSPIIFPLSCPSSVLHSQNALTYVLPSMSNSNGTY